MKKSLMIPAWVFLTFYLVSITDSLHAQWQEIDVAQNPYLWTYDIQFINEFTGYLVGEAPSPTGPTLGYFFKTTDGGMSWVNYPLGDSGVYNGPNYTLLFLDANTGFVAGAYSGNKIFKTTNGGLNWRDFPAPYYIHGTQQYYDFSFINENTGYVSGRYGILARTTDAGITWDSIHFRFPQAVRAVWFADENTGYVCDANGNIHKTTDQSVSWNNVYQNGPGFTSLSFLNANTGFACGWRAVNNYRSVLKTTNGGTSWNTVFESPLAGTGSFECVRFLNADTGFVSGKGAVFKTIDGGQSWIQMDIVFTPVSQTFYNIFFLNGSTGFVAATGGKIYKTETGGVNIQNISSEIPPGFSLHQNYPNPFNPTTNIKFSLPTTQYTILKIFDALGREVASLVNENLQAGVYQYQFTTDKYQLPSGVYFYRLSAGEFSETKRLVLLK